MCRIKFNTETSLRESHFDQDRRIGIYVFEYTLTLLKDIQPSVAYMLTCL